jgi:hypothetical protein
MRRRRAVRSGRTRLRCPRCEAHCITARQRARPGTHNSGTPPGRGRSRCFRHAGSREQGGSARSAIDGLIVIVPVAYPKSWVAALSQGDQLRKRQVLAACSPWWARGRRLPALVPLRSVVAGRFRAVRERNAARWRYSHIPTSSQSGHRSNRSGDAILSGQPH